MADDRLPGEDPLFDAGTPDAPAGVVAAPPTRRPPQPGPDAAAAPNGWTWRDGRWQAKKPVGRPRQPKPKTIPGATTGPATAARKPPVKRADRKPVIASLVESVAFLLAALPIPEKAFGRDLSEVRVRTRVQSHLLKTNAGSLAAGGDEIAAHTPWLARGLDRVEAGEGGLWVIPAMLLIAPFVAQTVQTWRDDLTESMVDIAERVEADMSATVAGALAGLAEAAARATGDANADYRPDGD